MEVSGNCFGTPFSVDTCRYDSSGISGSFATREKSFHLYVLKCFSIAGDADGS